MFKSLRRVIFIATVLLYSTSAMADDGDALIESCRIGDTKTYYASCIDELYLESDKELNVIYKKLMKALSSKRQQEVRQA